MLTSSLGRRPAFEFSAKPCGSPDIGRPPARPEGSWELVARGCGLALFLPSRQLPRVGPALPPVTSHLQAIW